MQPKSKTTNTKKSNKSFLSRLSDWKEKTKDMRVFQYSFGIITLTLGIFMFIVLINFIVSYSSDQSVIEDITMADENGRSLDVEEVSNKGGRVGVLLGQFFVQKCFGISSILIPIFIILLGLRILRFYSRKILLDFISLTFIMFWVSIFLAFTLKPFYDNSSIFWGGIIGLNISKWLIIQIGAIGLILLLISTALIYAATVNYTALISALLYVKNLVVSLVKKMFAKREGSYDEEEELEEEVESLETIVPKVENQEIDSLDLNDEEFESKVDIVENQTIYSSDKVSFTFTNEPVESVDKPIEVEIVDVKQDEIVDTSNRAPYNPISELKDYSYPTLDLMRQFSNDAPTIDTEEQAANKDKIISTSGVSINAH